MQGGRDPVTRKRPIIMGPEPPRYPRTLTCSGSTIEVARMVPGDIAALGTFVASMPTHDLLFLRRDISHPKVVAAWMEALGDGRVTSLVARQGDVVVGCTAIVTTALPWQRHVGDLRVLFLPALRGKGLGQLLIQECFALALGIGLEKLTVQATADQRAALAAFQSIGFRVEGRLHDHVRDRDGGTHNLVLLGHDVAAAQSILQAYGMADVLSAQQEVA